MLKQLLLFMFALVMVVLQSIYSVTGVVATDDTGDVTAGINSSASNFTFRRRRFEGGTNIVLASTTTSGDGCLTGGCDEGLEPPVEIGIGAGGISRMRDRGHGAVTSKFFSGSLSFGFGDGLSFGEVFAAAMIASLLSLPLSPAQATGEVDPESEDETGSDAAKLEVSSATARVPSSPRTTSTTGSVLAT